MSRAPKQKGGVRVVPASILALEEAARRRIDEGLARVRQRNAACVACEDTGYVPAQYGKVMAGSKPCAPCRAAAERTTAACPHAAVSQGGICKACGALRCDDGSWEAPMVPVRAPRASAADVQAPPEPAKEP